MKKIKNFIEVLYGITMLVLFVLGCGLLDGGKVGWSFFVFGVLIVMGALYDPLFPAKNKQEDAV